MQKLLAILEILQMDQLLGQGVESLVQTTNVIEILGVLLGSGPEGTYAFSTFFFSISLLKF